MFKSLIDLLQLRKDISDLTKRVTEIEKRYPKGKVMRVNTDNVYKEVKKDENI